MTDPPSNRDVHNLFEVNVQFPCLDEPRSLNHPLDLQFAQAHQAKAASQQKLFLASLLVSVRPD
jgi:hypothetical protein